VRTDTHRRTDRQTKVKTVYPPVSVRSLGGYYNDTRYNEGVHPPFVGVTAGRPTWINGRDTRRGRRQNVNSSK